MGKIKRGSMSISPESQAIYKKVQEDNKRSKILSEAEQAENQIAKTSGDSTIIRRADGNAIGQINVELLDAFPQNREEVNEAKIEALAEAIKTGGFTGAITVVEEFDTDVPFITANSLPSDDMYYKRRSGTPNGRYIILAGHNRVIAFKKVLETKRFKSQADSLIPATILSADKSWSKLRLKNIGDNAVMTDLSQKEKLDYIQELHAQSEHENGTARGEIDKIIQALGVKSLQASRLRDIALLLNNETLINAVTDEKISIKSAAAVAKLPDEYQTKAAEIYTENGKFTDEDATALSHEYKNSEGRKQQRINELQIKIQEKEAEIQKLKESKLEEALSDDEKAEIDRKLNNARSAISISNSEISKHLNSDTSQKKIQSSKPTDVKEMNSIRKWKDRNISQISTWPDSKKKELRLYLEEMLAAIKI